MSASFRSFDETELRGHLFLPGEGRFPTVCLCHGIPVSPREPGDRGYADVAEAFCRRGVAALHFNFRGVGLSGGEFDLLAWPADLEAAIDFLYNHESVDRSRLGVAGFSGGALAALYVASRDPRVKALALCATPADTSKITLERAEETVAMARRSGSLRGVDRPGAALKLKRDFEALNPLSLISSVACPVLILHGEADELIPPSQAEELYRLARGPKRLRIVKGAGHKLRLYAEAVEELVKWFCELWLPQPPTS
ncbi:MAG: alpha/beta fold hydrolase [Candidatus Nezhaarchaeales archaeon]